MAEKFDFGMIGLGVMGRNYLLNISDQGYSAAGLDLDIERVEALNRESSDKPIQGTTDAAEFMDMLKRPRKIMLLVPAGKAVDMVIESLLPHLDAGDLIIDGGNSHYDETQRRFDELKDKKVYFLGVGISGGEEGARHGPSIMPGGSEEAYELVRPILEGTAAKVNGEPCIAYMGDGSAGHFVKMVHNGIEYGLMQLIAETYDLLQHVIGASNEELHGIFSGWDQGRLRSYLIEITAEIFEKKDDQTGDYLIDIILDKAKQKGTGKWTSQAAMDMGIPIPSIDSAVSMRALSSFKQKRVEASEELSAVTAENNIDRKQFLEHLEKALFAGFVITYAQGLHLLTEASVEYKYRLDLERIARIWRGGCIIRADLLETIRKAYKKEPRLKNIIFSQFFQENLIEALPSLRMIAQAGIGRGIPLLTYSAALNYFQAFHTARLPLNLVQAQRDFFGSHTYERTDKEGVFHTDWE